MEAGIFSHSGWPFVLDDRQYYAHADEGYDGGLTVLDLSVPAEPEVVSRFETRDGISIHNLQVVDGIAYVAYNIDGLRVIDLRDPSSPRVIAHWDTVPDEDEREISGQGAWGVRVVGNLVYISDIEGGIYAFRVEVE